MTRAKYIPAQDHHIRIGAVVHVKMSDYPFKEWKRVVIDYDNIFKFLNQIVYNPDAIRIPTLTHEDIVGEGWEYKSSDKNADYYTYFNSRSEVWDIEYYAQENDLYIIDYNEDSLRFTIQTLLEFRDLMRFLGINVCSR